MKTKIELGDEVKDKVSGFKGVVVSEHIYLNGCTRFSVLPKVGKDGSYKESEAFDEPQLKVVTKGKFKKDNKSSSPLGGPAKFVDSRRL